MSSYTLSALAGAGAQWFDDNGNVLSGGKIYTYQAGTTTLAATYTNNLGSAANTNPIVLDAAGRVPAEIWFPVGSKFKFVVKTSTETLIGTYDNIPSINDPYSEGSLLSNVTGTNTIAATASPTITSYSTGAAYSFIAVNTNTGAVTLSIDGLIAKNVTKVGSQPLVAGDILAGMLVYVHYDGIRFQMIGNVVYGGSVTNATISGGTISGATITGGSVSGLATDLAIADGGTGASTALAAFDALKQASTDTYAGVVELATAAEAAAGTDTTRPITPSTLRDGLNSTGTAPVYAARAWVNFNGTGTVAIRSSGNVSSITDNGVGNYTVNFTTAMPDANYAVVGSVAGSTGVGAAGNNVIAEAIGVAGTSYSNKTTSSVQILTSDNNNDSLIDAFSANIAIFR